MTIVFDQISSSGRVPGSRVEFSNVRALAGLPAAQQKLLLVGQRLSTGTVAALTPVRITQVDQGAAYFGRGSVLAGMVAAAIAANPATEIWAIGIDDNAGGTVAYNTITLTGPATGAGTLSYLIGGQRVQVSVASGDSVTLMAGRIAVAINANADLPVFATSNAGVVSIGCRHKGTVGNDIDIRQNHYESEVTPAGVTSSIASTIAGAGNPDITTVWAAIGDEWYQHIALGLNDATSLTATDTEMVRRWGPAVQREGRAIAAISGSFSTCAAFGATRNGIFTTIVGTNKMPTPTWRIAAAVTAVAAFELGKDPARPLTDVVVAGMIAPKIVDRFSSTERDQLLSAGISTLRTLPGGDVAIERLICCYQLNALGFPDPSYRDVMTTATLGYLRFSWRARMAQKFPRAKLTLDTIASIRAETIALARDWFDAGLVEDVEGLIAGLVIERDGGNVNQLNVLLTPNIVNPLLQLAGRIEFIL